MASIKQISFHPMALPDFRNLGIALRILLLVNGMDILAAMLLTDTREATWQMLVELSTISQPLVIFSLLVLYTINRWLAKLPYGLGVVAVMALELLLAGSMHWMVVNILNWEYMPTLARFSVFTVIVSGIMLDYLSLRNRALSKAIAEARLQALQARIRPHFLFNSINAVLSLIRSDPKRAESAMEDMADLFRVLMADNRELVPLHSEVDLCCRYLELEKLRLGERLRIDWRIDKMPLDALIPPLVLQPLLENAVYHGIEPAPEGGEVVIDIYLSRNEVHLVLTNPFSKEGRHQSGNKMALGNIRERLALHFDVLASLTAKVMDSRYQVHITLPYRKAGEA
jgi:two-component system sensor histidine kinase AlgZ